MRNDPEGLESRLAHGNPDGYDSERGSELAERLCALLYKADLDTGDLERELLRLDGTFGDETYAELIFLLSHLRFAPQEARRHWRQLMAHRVSMAERLGTSVDLRVALVSYFIEVDRRIETPKVIELRLFEKTLASAYLDELTGLCNFRFFRDHLSREIQRSSRYDDPLSLLMLDVDDFKQYSDRNGHERGSEALSVVARLLTRSIRKIDLPARYGGEKFALILPSTSKIGARLVAERTRARVEMHAFPDEEAQPGGRLTVSVGLATSPADAHDAGELVRHADRALYLAKDGGKNRVHLYGHDRRSFRRVDARLDGRICLIAGEYRPLTTVNISQRGVLFVVDRQLPEGALVEIKLALPGRDREIATSGRVIRIKQTDRGHFAAAVRILDTSVENQMPLADYIRRSAAD